MHYHLQQATCWFLLACAAGALCGCVGRPIAQDGRDAGTNGPNWAAEPRYPPKPSAAGEAPVNTTLDPRLQREVPRVIFMDEVHNQGTQDTHEARPVETPDDVVAISLASAQTDPALSSPDAAQDVPSDPHPLESAEPVLEEAEAPNPTEPLVRELQALREGSEPAMARALKAATLLAAEPGRTLTEVNLKGLDASQQAMVRQYHQLVVALAQQLADDGGLDEQGLAARLEQLVGRQPIRIRVLALCRRVRGFGDYDPFENNTFIAGRPNAMVLYVEVDRFTVHERTDGMNEVSLVQEVVLYTDPGGTAVWRQDAVGIVDESRNRRRDFFVTQLIRLPQTLGVGKYFLKVTVTDQHSKTVDEKQAELQIVADRQMAEGKG